MKNKKKTERKEGGAFCYFETMYFIIKSLLGQK
jgi:hypothetical protein